MAEDILKKLRKAEDGLSTYEYIANNIGNCDELMPALVENMINVDRNGQFVVSTARYLHAIDAEKYVYSSEVARRVRNDLKIDKDYVIGHVGRFNPQKNHAFLLDVFAECVKINANVKLILVGDGTGKKQIQDKVESLGIKNNVIFMGVRTDVNELLQAMDVFVFPSLYEGLGISVIEAQAAGLPCVISDCIPDDCIVTKGLVEKLSLSTPPMQWAQVIMNLRGTYRTNQTRNAGYDILEATKKLEGFYLNKYAESKEKE